MVGKSLLSNIRPLALHPHIRQEHIEYFIKKFDSTFSLMKCEIEFFEREIKWNDDKK